MNIDELPFLPTRKSDTVEFLARPEIERIAKTVAAFLNGQGGILLIGFSDDGEMIGLSKDVESSAEQLRVDIGSAVTPSEWLQINPIQSGDRTSLLVEVPEGSRKPYLASGRVYVRKGGKDVEAKPGDVSRLIRQRADAELRWERMPFVGLPPEMLDPELIEEAEKAARSGIRDVRATSTLDRLQILDLVSEGWPNGAAAALFITEKAARQRLPQARAQFAAFEDDTLTVIADRVEATGGALHLLERLFPVLRLSIATRARLPDLALQRAEQPRYPLNAVREALVNALIHREYRDPGAIRVSLFPDRLEVWNPGTLSAAYINDPDARLVSRPHNPDVARVFNYVGYAEMMGIGMWRIRQEMATAGLPAPQWANHGGGVLLTLRAGERAGPTPGKETAISTRAVAYLRNSEPNERITTTQYRDRFAAGVSERSARNDLRSLVELGYLRQEGRGYQTSYVRLPKNYDD